MTGQIIQFDKYGELSRGRLYRGQAVPRGVAPSLRLPDPARPARGGKIADPAAVRSRNVKQQLARIGRLLSELEELANTSRNVPAATLGQARSGIEWAHRVLQLQLPDDDVEGDSQPELDDEKLERMYRDINREL